MPVSDRLLHDNPFAGDDGSIQPALAEAYAAPDFMRTESIIAALDRVLTPVLPHARPASGPHEPRSADPLECPDEELATTDFPGGRKALPVFSSVQALNAWNPKARPVPIAIKDIAVAALKRSNGLIVLDPGSPEQTWIGRSAVAALASETDWLAPWDDPIMTDSIMAAIDGHLGGLDRVTIEPGKAGTAVVVLHLIPGTERQQVISIAQTIAAILGSEPYVKARLDTVELRPFYAGA